MGRVERRRIRPRAYLDALSARAVGLLRGRPHAAQLRARDARRLAQNRLAGPAQHPRAAVLHGSSAHRQHGRDKSGMDRHTERPAHAAGRSHSGAPAGRGKRRRSENGVFLQGDRRSGQNSRHSLRTGRTRPDCLPHRRSQTGRRGTDDGQPGDAHRNSVRPHTPGDLRHLDTHRVRETGTVHAGDVRTDDHLPQKGAGCRRRPRLLHRGHGVRRAADVRAQHLRRADHAVRRAALRDDPPLWRQDHRAPPRQRHRHPGAHRRPGRGWHPAHRGAAHRRLHLRRCKATYW